MLLNNSVKANSINDFCYINAAIVQTNDYSEYVAELSNNGGCYGYSNIYTKIDPAGTRWVKHCDGTGDNSILPEDEEVCCEEMFEDILSTLKLEWEEGSDKFWVDIVPEE